MPLPWVTTTILASGAGADVVLDVAHGDAGDAGVIDVIDHFFFRSRGSGGRGLGPTGAA